MGGGSREAERHDPPHRQPVRERARDRHREPGSDPLRRNEKPGVPGGLAPNLPEIRGHQQQPAEERGPNRNIVVTATVRLRLRNSRRSSSGCAGRNVCHTNAAISTIPIAIVT